MRVQEIKLTKTELKQLLSYCNDVQEQGWYYGNKEQFEKRHFEITTQLSRVLEEYIT